MSSFELGRVKSFLEEALLQYRYHSILTDLFNISFPDGVPSDIMNHYSRLSTDRLAEDLSYLYPIVVHDLLSQERKDFVSAYFKYRVGHGFSNELAILYAKLEFVLALGNLPLTSSMMDICRIADKKDLIDFAFKIRHQFSNVASLLWDVDDVKTHNLEKPFDMTQEMAKSLKEKTDKSAFYAFARYYLGLEHSEAEKLLA